MKQGQPVVWTDGKPEVAVDGVLEAVHRFRLHFLGFLLLLENVCER